MNKSELIEIPGHPKYMIRVDDESVISFKYLDTGYSLKRLNKGEYYSGIGYVPHTGYCLFTNKIRMVISMLEIRSLISNHLERNKNMSVTTKQNGGLKTGNYIVGSITKGDLNVSLAANPMVHNVLTLAKNEAARLAGLDKTKKYLVLEVKAVASVADISWE